eukprot:TRINITY_DN952_c0_g1_i1.p1 TRINITY_DN952_c0_g1~~TRINITY_DN952_c0_g1_i1.p1  ORF type:complete len:419 (-),score=115.46 TRINITY_DN952_c0_g1_i1:93-1268(-)
MLRMCAGFRQGCGQRGRDEEMVSHEAQCISFLQEKRVQQLEQAMKIYIDGQDLLINTRIEQLVLQQRLLQFRLDSMFISRDQLPPDVLKNIRTTEIQKYSAARFSFGAGGPSLGQFACPKSIAVDGERALAYVCDKDNHRVQIFDLTDRSILAAFGQEGQGPGVYFKNPSGIALDVQGKRLFVCDTGNHRVQVFDLIHEGNARCPRAQHNCSFGGYGPALGQLLGPCGIAVDPVTGFVVVCDTYNNRVHVFNTSFQAERMFGSRGTSNGLFASPLALTVDHNGHYFVCDTGNHRVQVFDAAGTRIKTFGSEGVGNGQFKNPSGIAVDRQGNVFVCDSHNHRVQVFDLNWKHLRSIGSEGSAPDQLFYPVGLSVVSNLLVVCDTQNNRIQIF